MHGHMNVKHSSYLFHYGNYNVKHVNNEVLIYNFKSFLPSSFSRIQSTAGHYDVTHNLTYVTAVSSLCIMTWTT